MTFTFGTGPFGDQGDKTFNFEVRSPETTYYSSANPSVGDRPPPR